MIETVSNWPCYPLWANGVGLYKVVSEVGFNWIVGSCETNSTAVLAMQTSSTCGDAPLKFGEMLNSNQSDNEQVHDDISSMWMLIDQLYTVGDQ